MSEEHQKGRGCGYGCLMMLLGAVVTLVLVSLIGLGLGGFILGPSLEGGLGRWPEDEKPRLRERWSYGSGKVKAARIELAGVIMREVESGLFAAQYDRVEAVLRQIRAARSDGQVRGILLEVDSPGGEISACEEIRQALREFGGQGSGRKVVVWVRGVGASGAYYIATAGDWIVAEPSAVVGSIGVILSALNWKDLTQRIGVTNVTIKSGDYKDLLNPFREVQPEEQAMLQHVVDSLHERLVDAVAEGRGLGRDEVSRLADGRIFLAEEARELGMVDEVGYWSAAYKRLKDVLGVDELRLIRYEGARGMLGFLRAMSDWSPFSAGRIMGEPRLLYLWTP